MSESGELALPLREVVSGVLASLRAGDISRMAAQICDACVSLLPVDGASMSLMLGAGHRQSLHATDAVMEHVEAVQFTLGEGPCFEAFQTGQPLLVPDLVRDAGVSWPMFTAEMSGDPIGAIYAFPLRRGAARFGAIDMYRRTAGWLSDAELAMALQLTDIAASALLAVSGGAGDQFDEDGLIELSGIRAVVHQATGMVVAEFKIPADQALSRLRGYAFAAGRLLDDVAADLVSRRLHPDVMTN